MSAPEWRKIIYRTTREALETAVWKIAVALLAVLGASDAILTKLS